LTETIATVPPSLVAWRLKTVLDLDMSKDFARSTVPTLYLRGTTIDSSPSAAGA
jgi:hypothetical protein